MIQIICELKGGLSLCAPVSKKVTVTGDLDAGLKALIKELGADNFEERRNAVRGLVEVGKAAIPFLERAATNADPEVRMNAKKVLKKLKGE